MTSDLHFTNRKAKRPLGWTPRVPLVHGVTNTVARYRAGMP